MNPFPDFIILPTTAHRIPRTSNAEELVHKLLDLEVNAYAFLMDVDLLAEVEAKGFRNDPDRARQDLIKQLPSHVRDAVFPPPPEPEEDSSDDEGKDSAPVKGPRLKISMHDALVTLPKDQSEVSPPKKLNSSSQSFPPHVPNHQQHPKKKSSGISLSM